MSPLTVITDRDFTSEVLRSDVPVLMACGAAWCVQSNELRPTLEASAARYEGRAKVVEIDVGDDPRANKILRRYGASRVPMVMLFQEGQLKDWVGGRASSEVINEMLERRFRPVLEVGEHDFDAEVLSSAMPVLVFFAASWCGACVELEPLVESAAERFRGRAKVVRVEFGPSNGALIARYGVSRVPTLKLFDGGEVRDQIFGRASLDSVTEMLEERVL